MARGHGICRRGDLFLVAAIVKLHGARPWHRFSTSSGSISTYETPQDRHHRCTRSCRGNVYARSSGWFLASLRHVSWRRAGGGVWGWRDTRPSSLMVRAAVVAGLLASGCEVIDLGVCPTPSLQLAVNWLKAD